MSATQYGFWLLCRTHALTNLETSVRLSSKPSGEYFSPADVAHVAGVEPAVDDGVGRGLGVLPVARHHVLATDDNLTAGAVRDFLALGVQDDTVHRLHQSAGGPEAGVALGVRADDRSGLGEAVALEHGHAHGAEESLEFDVQQGAAAHEKLHPAAETLTYLLEQDLVEQGHERLPPEGAAGAAVVVFLVVLDGVVEGEVEEFLHLLTLLLDAGLDVLLEVAGQSRDGQHHVWTRFGDGCRDIAQGGEGVLADGHECDAKQWSSGRMMSMVESGPMEMTELPWATLAV